MFAGAHSVARAREEESRQTRLQNRPGIADALVPRGCGMLRLAQSAGNGRMSGGKTISAKEAWACGRGGRWCRKSKVRAEPWIPR